jgi:hypothetical protein
VTNMYFLLFDAEFNLVSFICRAIVIPTLASLFDQESKQCKLPGTTIA